MSRKTYSLSAIAVAAVAGLSFLSTDGAEAIAQDAAAQPAATESETTAQEQVEIVPQQPVFVSEAVVQEVDETAEEDPQTPKFHSAASLRELVAKVDQGDDMSEQLRCLAGAVYFESRGEELAGQLAVAQVIINRSEDGRWPASYCGVVHQRSQFSFVKNGRMPTIKTGSAAWQRAKAIARIAHDGMWESEVGKATYFHAKYVSPSWSKRKTRLAQIDTHVFYR